MGHDANHIAVRSLTPANCTPPYQISFFLWDGPKLRASIDFQAFGRLNYSNARNFESAASTSLPFASIAASSSVGVRVSMIFFSRGLTAFRS